MVNEVITIGLTSCTLFAEQLAVETDGELLDLEDWLRQNANHDWRVYSKGVWFSDPGDAAYCRLVWGR